MLAGLPTHRIDAGNVDTLLSVLALPAELSEHIRATVMAGASVIISEVVLEHEGREVLVFQVEETATGDTQFVAFDTLAGGAGTENPPGSLGNSAGNTGDFDGAAFEGDPVNIANGNFLREETDFLIPTQGMPFGFPAIL